MPESKSRNKHTSLDAWARRVAAAVGVSKNILHRGVVNKETSQYMGEPKDVQAYLDMISRRARCRRHHFTAVHAVTGNAFRFGEDGSLPLTRDTAEYFVRLAEYCHLVEEVIEIAAQLEDAHQHMGVIDATLLSYAMSAAALVHASKRRRSGEAVATGVLAYTTRVVAALRGDRKSLATAIATTEAELLFKYGITLRRPTWSTAPASYYSYFAAGSCTAGINAVNSALRALATSRGQTYTGGEDPFVYWSDKAALRCATEAVGAVDRVASDLDYSVATPSTDPGWMPSSVPVQLDAEADAGANPVPADFDYSPGGQSTESMPMAGPANPDAAERVGAAADPDAEDVLPDLDDLSDRRRRGRDGEAADNSFNGKDA